MLQHEVAGLPGVHQLGHDVALFVQMNVGLRDQVLVFFPSRQVVAVGFEFDRLLLGAEVAIGFIHFGARHHVADLIRGIARIQNPDFIDHRALQHAPVRALDEPIFVDARKARKRRDQADVRAFRRLDGADAAVVRGMHVADFESGALAGQTAWSQGRKTALVRDLRQRVGLIHELRELAGAEELADRRHHGLGVHQVVRHGRRHFLVHRHLFFDGALHAHQADAELVFEQLAHRANAAIAQVIDIVDGADAAAQLQQVLDGVDEVLLIERPLVERRGVDFVVQLDVELHAAHARKVVLARVEEHALEQLCGRVERRRIARTQLAVDFEQRVVLALHRIFAQRDRNHVAHFVALGEKHLKRRDAVVQHLVDVGEFLIGFHQHFAGGHVDHVGRDVGALQVGRDRFPLARSWP